MTLLSVKALSKNFGGVKALTQVSFDVLQGDILALIGPNGAGKTTCFNMINGLLPPTSGAIFMEGNELTGLPPYRRAARGLARTFQNVQLFGGMTVLENVLTGMHLSQKAGVVTALLPLPGVLLAEVQNRQRAREWLDFVNLGDKADWPAETLAYGEQRRLEIARALAQAPKLLLLDEPAAGLNPRETEDLMNLMVRLRDLGHHPPGHRARHDPGHGPVPTHRGPGPGPGHRRGQPSGYQAPPPGHRGLFRERRA